MPRVAFVGMTAAERFRCLEKRFGLFDKSETVATLERPLM